MYLTIKILHYSVFLSLFRKVKFDGMPVVASNERSFLKLKLLKTYLRAAMSYAMLSDLGSLSIERNGYSEIEMFAPRKARNVKISAVLASSFSFWGRSN